MKKTEVRERLETLRIGSFGKGRSLAKKQILESRGTV